MRTLQIVAAACAVVVELAAAQPLFAQALRPPVANRPFDLVIDPASLRDVQGQSRPVPVRQSRFPRRLLPVIIGAGVGFGVGLIVFHGTDFPVKGAMIYSAAGAGIGGVIAIF